MNRFDYLFQCYLNMTFWGGWASFVIFYFISKILLVTLLKYAHFVFEIWSQSLNWYGTEGGHIMKLFIHQLKFEMCHCIRISVFENTFERNTYVVKVDLKFSTLFTDSKSLHYTISLFFYLFYWTAHILF